MKTYEIKKSEIEGLELLAVGYKAVNYDNGTQQTFRYGEKGENLIGRIFKVDGNVKECKWGLHFSKDPANVFNFYEPLGYNKYFKVHAYGNCVDSTDGLKSVAQVIEFVEEYDIMQYIDIIKKFDRTAVSDSNAVSWSNAVMDSYGLRKCEAVKNGVFCFEIEGAKNIIFNKPVSEKRFKEVYRAITRFDYRPNWDNFYELKGNKAWWSIAFPELMFVDNKTAWSKMPIKMVDYIKSLPEYDETVFENITVRE